VNLVFIIKNKHEQRNVVSAPCRSYNGQTYVLFSDLRKSFLIAETFCRQALGGGHLVSICSQDQNEFVTTFLAENG
jgi:hypothetical protein